MFGFNYCELGADIAADWHFPDAIQSAIRLHINPPEDREEPLTDLIHVAWVIGSTVNNQVQASFNQAAIQRMKLNDDAGASFLEQATQEATSSSGSVNAL